MKPDALRNPEPLVIDNDRGLLFALGMSDATAAEAIGKTRQALNVKLGAQRNKESGGQRPLYFKASDILLLILHAQHARLRFDEFAVMDYVGGTAGERGGSKETYGQIRANLTGEEDFDLDAAGTVVLVLPAFTEISTQLPEFSRGLERLVQMLAKLDAMPWIIVLSSNKLQADMAKESLGLPAERTRAFAHEYADYFVPCVLIYPTGGQTPRAYALNERGTLGPAPRFRIGTMGEYIKFMLPVKERTELFKHE
jgi:hypothetical protein